MGNPIIQTANLEHAFTALRNGRPQDIRSGSSDALSYPNQNYPSGGNSRGAFNSGELNKVASAAGGGTIYGQPQFFSPVHTPINWQIPSKRLEQYQWLHLPNTQVLTANYTYTPIENTPFTYSDIIEDSVVAGGFIFEAEDYPEIMNSEGTFNQPPRMSMRDCEDKRCFSFKPIGNWRTLRISEEHYIFVLDGKAHRKNKKVLTGKKYRAKKDVTPNGVEKVKIEDKLVRRIQAQDVNRKDYLLTPVPNVGKKSLDPELAWLTGLCVADGCLCWTKGRYDVHFTGCKDEVSLVKCEELLKRHFSGTVSSRQHGDGNGLRVRASTKETNNYFKQYIVNKGISKRLSKAVFDLDKEARLSIIAGYLDGDGCLEKPCGKNGGGRLISNCYSKDLADQMYWLLVSCGITCSLGKYPLYGDHYPTDSECAYRILIPSSQVPLIAPYMRGDKAHNNFVPKKERELKFFYEEDGVTYLASPIEKIEEFLYTGKGFDIEMTNDRHALVADGYVCSNSRFFYENEPKVAASIDFYCFEPDSFVLLSDGRQKRISSIKEGDMVRSHDGSANMVEKVNQRSTDEEEMLKIKIAGVGGVYTPKIKVTKGHEMLTERDGEVKFVQSGTLKEGDYLLTPCGYGEKQEDVSPCLIKGNYIYRKIYSLEEYIYDGELYDLSIQNCHSYVVNRIAVHNSYFPMNDYTHECKDRMVKNYFDKFKKRLELPKWLRLMSHEIHKLGDCFPFVEISCEHCGGSGRCGDEICEHDGGTVKRIVILNPDYVEVYTSPLNPEPVIALKADEELTNMVSGKTPGSERLTPQVRALISSGQPIRLDNRNVSHLMYGEGGYAKYGTGMVRRLFPTLSYKTKLMVAQWIVAERLIVPIKIVKVGNDERPAGPADIAAVQEQLAQTANDPNLTIVTHHAFDLEWYGASGKVLKLSNEFEFINQEILDGMMINNALLNGEGPNYSSASIGIESTIERLESFRREIAAWVENSIYLPEARRQGFVEIDEDTGEEELIVPTIKWNSMHLRDQQQYRQSVLQLYEKGLLSAQTVLEVFDFNPDQEIERKRYDALQMQALGGGMGGDAGGMGGGFGGDMGGMPGMGGGDAGGMGGDIGGDIGGDLGGGMGGGMGGGEMAGAGGEPATAASNRAIKTAQVSTADPSQFGGKILTKKTRDRLESEQKKTLAKNPNGQENKTQGPTRDQKGRVVFTEPEMELLDGITRYQQDGLLRYRVIPQFPVQYGSQEYPLDFAIPQLKLGIEADGEMFHSNPKQMTHDKERDGKLAQLGWTILRFKDDEIKKRIEQVMQTVLKSIMKKEMMLKQMMAENK